MAGLYIKSFIINISLSRVPSIGPDTKQMFSKGLLKYKYFPSPRPFSSNIALSLSDLNGPESLLWPLIIILCANIVLCLFLCLLFIRLPSVFRLPLSFVIG